MSSLISTLGIQKYELTLPSSGRRIHYRPFLVKEEKLLLIASESKNENEIYNAINQVVSSCTFGEFESNNAPVIDLEYLFLKIRSKSVGEKATPSIKCGKCGVSSEINVDLSEIEPVTNEAHKKKIVISPDVIVEMGYPRLKDMEIFNEDRPELDKATSVLASCIQTVYTKNEVFHAKDIEREEIENFILHLSQDQLKKMMGFIETMPKLKKEVDFECKKCQNKEKITLEGMRDFF